MGRPSFFQSSSTKQSQADSAMRLGQGVPYYQAIPVSYTKAYQAYQYEYAPSYDGESQVAIKKPTPRLSPLIIPYQPSPRPVCVNLTQPNQKQRAQYQRQALQTQHQQPQQQPRNPQHQYRQQQQESQYQQQPLPPYQRQPQQQHQWQQPQYQQPQQSRQPPQQATQYQQPPPQHQQHRQQPPQPRDKKPDPTIISPETPAPTPAPPPPRPPKHQVKEIQREDNIDYFEFQYPCMLPPETITLARPATITSSPAVPSPRYSLPVLPSESSTPPLQRPKPYLQSRRQRMPTRDSIRVVPRRGLTRDELHGIAPPLQTAAFPLALPGLNLRGGVVSEQWYDFIESAGSSVLSGESTPTPVGGAARGQETPIEYKAQQAAALHDLLGMVLGEAKGQTSAGLELDWDEGDDYVTVLEEEVELAARGYTKFSADEYLSEVRDVWTSFESPL